MKVQSGAEGRGKGKEKGEGKGKENGKGNGRAHFDAFSLSPSRPQRKSKPTPLTCDSTFLFFNSVMKVRLHHSVITELMNFVVTTVQVVGVVLVAGVVMVVVAEVVAVVVVGLMGVVVEVVVVFILILC